MVSGGHGFGVTDHVCWLYGTHARFLDAATEFLADGLAAGERLMYTSARSLPAMRAELAGIPDADRLLDDGGLLLCSLSDMYDPAGAAEPEREFAAWAQAGEQAVRDGYRGLRSVSDATELVVSPQRRTAQVRLEHLAEQYLATGHPIAAMCAYDRQRLGDETVSDVAAMHPLVHGPGTFAERRLYFDEGRLVLAGAVDHFSTDQLARLLAACHRDGTEVILDVGELEFIDARGLFVLARWGRQLADNGGSLRIEHASGVMRRAWEALNFHRSPGVILAGAAA